MLGTDVSLSNKLVHANALSFGVPGYVTKFVGLLCKRALGIYNQWFLHNRLVRIKYIGNFALGGLFATA